MTLLVAVGLVVGACFLWPARRVPLDVDVADVGVDVADAGGRRAGRSPGKDGTEETSADVATAEGGVTVDEAADALVLCALVLRAGLGPVEALEAVALHVRGPVAHQLRVVASASRWGQDAATSWAHVGEAWRPAACSKRTWQSPVAPSLSFRRGPWASERNATCQTVETGLVRQSV